MTEFIFENTKRKVLFLAAKIDFWGQNGVRTQEPRLMGLWCHELYSCQEGR